jgi:asparagine synthase (glutamine-hydrolysing)
MVRSILRLVAVSSVLKVSLNDWLKGDLRWVIDQYLDQALIKEQGIFNPAMVDKEKQDFLTGAQPYNRIWNIVVFQMWYNKYLSSTYE